MRVAAAIVVSLFTAFANASTQPGGEISQLQRRIQEEGARATAAALFADKSSWATLMKNVRSGKAEWINVAIHLRAGTDGGASSELQDALFAALARNPRHVLRVSAPVIPINVLCGGRSDPLPTAKAALSEIDRIKRSVGRIQDKNLSEQRKDCLTALEEATTSTKRFFKD